jgi:hypothetical protein
MTRQSRCSLPISRATRVAFSHSDGRSAKKNQLQTSNQGDVPVQKKITKGCGFANLIAQEFAAGKCIARSGWGEWGARNALSQEYFVTHITSPCMPAKCVCQTDWSLKRLPSKYAPRFHGRHQPLTRCGQLPSDISDGSITRPSP